MNYNEAIILHTVEDAEHCVKNKYHEGRLLFSTHASVPVYLKETYSISCQGIEELFTDERLASLRKTTLRKVDELLEILDSRISPRIAEQYGLRLEYFKTFYSYYGKFHFMALLVFTEAVQKIIREHTVSKLLLYESKLKSYLETEWNMRTLASFFFKDGEIQIIEHSQEAVSKTNKKKSFGSRLWHLLVRTSGQISYSLRRLRINLRSRILSDKKKTILLYEYLYDLDFLKNGLGGYNVLYYKNDQAIFPVGFTDDMQKINVSIDQREFELMDKKDDLVVAFFLKDIAHGFKKNINPAIKACLLLERFRKKYSIACGIWGNPPAAPGIKSLVFQYLRSSGIPVIGAQHGGCYGDQCVPTHLYSDFTRCDYYISYGFNQDDLQRALQVDSIPAKIFPLGKENLKSRGNREGETIDILFPPAPVSSTLNTILINTAGKLVNVQEKIMLHLDTLSGLLVYVKPVVNPNHNNYAFFPLHRKLRNIKVIDYLSLDEFLKLYAPKIVIMEYPSTPLYDVLHLDTEIFLVCSPENPYEKEALEKLKRRVHFAENVDELISQLNLFLNGKLQPKRDDSFYKHYLFKEGAQENILKLIDDVANGKM